MSGFQQVLTTRSSSECRVDVEAELEAVLEAEFGADWINGAKRQRVSEPTVLPLASADASEGAGPALGLAVGTRVADAGPALGLAGSLGSLAPGDLPLASLAPRVDYGLCMREETLCMGCAWPISMCLCGMDNWRVRHGLL